LPGVRPWRGPMAVVPGRMTEGGRRANSIAYGWQDVVRPHQYAVRPTRGWSGHPAAGVGGGWVGALRPRAAQPQAVGGLLIEVLQYRLRDNRMTNDRLTNSLNNQLTAKATLLPQNKHSVADTIDLDPREKFDNLISPHNLANQLQDTVDKIVQQCADV